MESSGQAKLYPDLQGPQQSLNPPPQPTVVQQVIVTKNFGPEPTNALCPNCQSNVTTSTSTEASAMAWVSCLLLCCFGCWPCAGIPFCVCQKTKHTCPSCNTFLGESN
eukprot:TRINITY_DN1754_c1_g2_i1.p1 TRINITY_DN1754_c1_g2~~TRINITY_DN1754_c1_g2_i1.p1  ORF type:complete len:108 (-),score=9.18 TRINITY_DN1754_c1_g2_i1:1264-1587(-)